MRTTSLAMAGLCLAVDPALAQAPMKVFVGAAQVEERKDVDEATKKTLKARLDAARNARKVKDKEIKAQHGKKREQWPPEKDDELYVLEEAEALANAEYEYRKIELKGISDSVQDIVESIQGKGSAGRKERVALATSAADADLVVQVLARRGEKVTSMVKPDYCYVYFSVGPGGSLDAAKFARVPTGYRIRKGFGWGIFRIAGPSAEAPYFRFESSNLMTSGSMGSFGCYGSAGNAASAAVDKFIEDNGALLTAP